MRTLAGSNACAGRLDQILKSHPLPHKLHSPGDLSKGEAFVTIVKNAVRISDADVEAWHSARTRTRDLPNWAVSRGKTLRLTRTWTASTNAARQSLGSSSVLNSLADDLSCARAFMWGPEIRHD